MIGDDINLLALQDRKRPGPDVLEGGALSDAVIRKELQHVSSLVEVLVALCAVFIHPLLGGVFGRIRRASDVMNHPGQQMVMELLIPMVHEAEQIEMDEPLVELRQPEDGIIGDERGIIPDVLIGDVEMRQELFGQFVEVMYLVPPGNFTGHLTGAKVPGFTLEARDGIEPLRILQQDLEGVDLRRSQMTA
jgi:hypothetical protein